MAKKGKVALLYDPKLSIKENAKRCGVTEGAIRKYIQRNGIDRIYDNKAIKATTIRNIKQNNPNITITEIARQVGCSASTIYRYLHHENNVIIKTDKVSKIGDFKPHNIIRSVSMSQDEILINILKLYVKKTAYDCDLTFSKGNFYKVIDKPLYRFDKYPITQDVQPLEQADMIADGTMSSVVFDLPFLVNASDTYAEKSIMCKRFNYFHTIEEMYETNDQMLELSYRLLKTGGYLIVKTMDVTHWGKQHWISAYVQDKARELGFSLEDMFILIGTDRNRIANRKATDRQIHARKFHSYFLVFKKK